MRNSTVSETSKRKKRGKTFRSLSFQGRLYYLFGAMGIICSIFAFISSVVTSLPPMAVGASFICMLCMMGNGIYFVLSKKLQTAAVLCCINTNLILFPLLFVFSGGAHSGMPLYFLLGLTVTVLILTGVVRLIVLTASLFIDTAALILYYSYPNRFLQLSHNMQRSDVISSFWIVALFLIIILLMLMYEVQAEQKRLIEYNQELTEKNYLDELTGLYNHRFVTMQLTNFCNRRSESEWNKLAVIMMDIDFFKQVNDRFGHLRGNDVLVRFAQILAKSTQKSCFATRYGGEEFLVILYDSSAEQVEEIAEQIRQRIESDKTLQKLTDGGITVSGGIARHQEGMTVESLIEQADKHLYQAKQLGRNQIAV